MREGGREGRRERREERESGNGLMVVDRMPLGFTNFSDNIRI